jgi:hypothetical protein
MPCHFIFPHFIARTILDEGYKSLSSSLIIFFHSLPCHLLNFRPKYSPQNTIIKHPQPISLRSSLIRTQVS